MKKLFSVFLTVIIVCASSITYSSAATVSTDSEDRLGGGPSPSAAWTYKNSGSDFFTSDEIHSLSGKMQGVIGSSSYQAGQMAYNASVAAVGFMGWNKVTQSLFSISSAGWGLFGSSYFSMIQSSANRLSAAASTKRGQTLNYKVYYRPANNEHILIFY